MSKKIVIVDDDPDARLYYSTILDDMGLEIVEAENGEEGTRKPPSEANYDATK